MTSKLKNFFDIYGKGFSLIVTMMLGVLLPQLHVLTYLVQYLLMIMLFFAFLGMELQLGVFRRGVGRVLLANLAIGFLCYGLVAYFAPDLALTAFLTGIAPTATASPVMISFIGGEVPFVVAAVLSTNILVALVIPFVLPGLAGNGIHIAAWQVLQPVLMVMFVPLLLAWLARMLPSKIRGLLYRGKTINFPVWLFNLLIISANASYFVRNQYSGSWTSLVQIALLALVICTVNFATGALIGSADFRQESSQGLGQKNITFVVWIALTFINPLAAMGPTFYVLYHNLYNSFQIYQFERQNNISREEMEKKNIFE